MEEVLNVVKEMIDNCEAFMVQNCSETLKVVIEDAVKKINSVNCCNRGRCTVLQDAISCILYA